MGSNYSKFKPTCILSPSQIKELEHLRYVHPSVIDKSSIKKLLHKMVLTFALNKEEYILTKEQTKV